MSIVNIANQADFADKVLKSAQPVLVDFWAPWCGPCKMVAPELEAVAADYDGKAVVAKVNVDEQPELAGQFKVMGIPTMVVFKNGAEVNRIVGFRPRRDIAAAIDGAV
ncbi:MAG: thioredoxin [Sporomusaceae bacterium]|jgi:thioredoxin 1|nr:thioredoxin [Sporomusaceae bacterium]